MGVQVPPPALLYFQLVIKFPVSSAMGWCPYRCPSRIPEASVWSKTLTAVCLWVWDRCEYRSVMVMSLCPNNSRIVFRSTPRMARCEANVCRKSWNRKSLIPALFRAFSKAVRILLSLCPCPSQKTYPQNSCPSWAFVALLSVWVKVWLIGISLRSPFLVSSTETWPVLNSTSFLSL